jgi:hypothetical protein
MSSLLHPRAVEPPDEWIDEHARLWVERGLVTDDQADRIRALEHESVPLARPVRVSIGAEVAIYLGSVLALVAGSFVVAESWDTMATAARLAVGAAIVLLGFLTAARLLRLDEPGTRRIASFLWVIGTGGVALMIGTLLDASDVDEPAWFLLAIGIPVLTLSALLWRNRDRPLQLITTAVGVGLTLGGIGALVDARAWIAGLVVLALSATVALLALDDRLHPTLYVLSIASIGAIVGSMMLIDLGESIGPAVAIVVSAAIVAIGLARHLVPVVVIGVLGFLQALQGLLLTVLHGAAATLGVAVAGLVIVAVAVVRSTREPHPPVA